MAGKSKKKKQDNLEKIKNEMTAKRQRAKTRQNAETVEVHTENTDPMTGAGIDFPVQACSDCIDNVAGNNDEDRIDYITAKDQDEKQQAEKVDAADGGRAKFVIFRIDEEEFAINVLNIKEVIRIPAIVKVPNAPAHVTGLCSLRGTLLPVIDSRKLFSMPEQEFGESSRIIVADIQGKQIGLVTDKVLEVIDVEETDICEPPSCFRGTDGSAISGILILDRGKRAVMVLDAERIIKAGELSTAPVQHCTSAGDSADPGKDEGEEEQIIIFNIGSGEYAFSIDYVKEIIRLTDITKVPDTASYIEGIFSIRNQLMAVINPAKLLGLDCSHPDEYSRVIIVSNGSLSFGVIVDKVSHVARVQKNLFRETGPSGNGSGTDFIRGIFTLDKGKRLVMMMEPRKLVCLKELEAITDVDADMAADDKSSNADDENGNLRCVVFRLCRQEYGINIRNVQEINRIDKITSFPGAPAFISGMVDFRGEIIPLLDLRKLFGIDETSSYNPDRFLVAEFRNKKTGILIDSVSEVRSFSNAQLEKAPDALKGSNQDCYIDWVAKLDDTGRVVSKLNLSALLGFM